MKDWEKLPDHILTDLKDRFDFESSSDTYLAKMTDLSREEVFREWLEYNGIIGYTNTILYVVEAIFHIRLERG